MTLPEGAFKSAIDAETDGEEGAYYVWSEEELRRILGDDGFALLAPIYGFDGGGGFEGGRHVLHLGAPLAEHAERLELSRPELLARVTPLLERLHAARERRERPLVDDKVLTDWNGMMIAAMARAGAILEEPRYLRAAEVAADFLLTRLDPADGPLRHAWRGGESKLDAFLDDYAFFVRGLLALHEATREARWLAAAVRLADELERRLAAPQGGYYLTAARPGLLFQPLSVTGGAVPAGNAIAIHDLLALAELTGEERFRERAERNLRIFARELEQHPTAVPMLAAAVLRGDRGRSAPPASSGEPQPAGAGTGSLDALADRLVEARVTTGDRVDGWRPLELRLRIEDGWHLNANPASEDFLIPTSIEGDVRDVEYPPGEPFRFAFSETALAVYGGEVTLRGEVAAEAKEVTLTYQACDDRRCLPPVDRILPLAGESRP